MSRDGDPGDEEAPAALPSGPVDSEASTVASSGVPSSDVDVPAYGTEVEKALEAARTWRQDLEQARREFAEKLAREYGLDAAETLAMPEATQVEAVSPREFAPDKSDAVGAPAGDEDSEADALLRGNAAALEALRSRQWPSPEEGGLKDLEFDLARLRADSAALTANSRSVAAELTTSARAEMRCLSPVSLAHLAESPSAAAVIDGNSVGGLAEELAALCADVDAVASSPRRGAKGTPDAQTSHLLAQCDALLEECDALLADP
jgi:hypothetical protein